MPLPQPPATFSDHPMTSSLQRGQQQPLRPELRLQPLASNEEAVSHESSVSFFFFFQSSTELLLASLPFPQFSHISERI